MAIFVVMVGENISSFACNFSVVTCEYRDVCFVVCREAKKRAVDGESQPHWGWICSLVLAERRLSKMSCSLANSAILYDLDREKVHDPNGIGIGRV